MLNFVMLNFAMLNAVMLNVVILNVVMLNVAAPCLDVNFERTNAIAASKISTGRPKLQNFLHL
jgi:hypothetical protein